jgi:hypothetical protein
MARLTSALAVAALLSACGALHPLASAQSAVVPWLPLPADMTPRPVASPQAVPVPPGTPICAASELEGAFTGRNGAGGHALESFAFSARGVKACQVEGTPVITLLDAAGHDLGFKNRAPFFPNEVSGPALVLPGPVPFEAEGLKYGQAGLTIDWVTQPEACPPGAAGSQVSTVRIAIANVGSFSYRLPQVPEAYACQGVGVGALAEPPVDVQGPPEPPVPNPAIIAPTKVTAGAQLQYMVMLTNPAKLPIDLRLHCPNYEEELFADIVHGSPPLGGKHFYALNCRVAGVLQPGERVSFAMVLQVPADATPGSYTLIFNIGISNAMTRIGRTAIVQII